MKFSVPLLTLCATVLQASTIHAETAGGGAFEVRNGQTAPSQGSDSSLASMVVNGFGLSEEQTGSYEKLVEIDSILERPRVNFLMVVVVEEMPNLDTISHVDDGELALHNIINGYARTYPESKIIATSENSHLLDIVTNGRLSPVQITEFSPLTSGLHAFTTGEQTDFAAFRAVESIVGMNLPNELSSHPDLYIVVAEQQTYGSDVTDKSDYVAQVLQKAYGRIAYEVAIVPKSSINTPRRKLQESSQITGFEGVHKFLMVFTAIVIVLLIISVFCCVPWSSELDPLLLSGIKTDSSYKMD